MLAQTHIVHSSVSQVNGEYIIDMCVQLCCKFRKAGQGYRIWGSMQMLPQSEKAIHMYIHTCIHTYYTHTDTHTHFCFKCSSCLSLTCTTEKKKRRGRCDWWLLVAVYTGGIYMYVVCYNDWGTIIYYSQTAQHECQGSGEVLRVYSWSPVMHAIPLWCSCQGSIMFPPGCTGS